MRATSAHPSPTRSESSPVGSRGRLPPFDLALRALYVLSFAAVVALFVSGASYYATPLGERARHPGYWDWKAGGRIGLRLGIVGAAMMTTMLLYSVRKRVKALRRAGPLRRWLDLHIYLGVFGPLLVILHTALKAGGLVAISFWSMVAVALSGVVGRYLYLQIPRTRAGEALTFQELEHLDRELLARLRREFHLEAPAIAALKALASPPRARGLLATIARLPLDDLHLRARLRGFARGQGRLSGPVLAEFERVLRQKALSERRIQLWDRLHDAFHYWHVIHKPFAVVMYVFMAVHIAVAVMTGYAWVGG